MIPDRVSQYTKGKVMKINYRRGDGFKQRPHAGKGKRFATSESLKWYKKDKANTFREQTKCAIREERYELLPVYKKNILWDVL